MIQFRGIGHYLIDLWIHIVRVTALVHIAHIVQIEKRQVEGLGPWFKFSLCNGLQPFILRKSLKGPKLEHAEGTQLIFNHRMVRIGGVGRGGRSAFGFIIRIAKRRTVKEYLRHHLAKLRIMGVVIFTIADTEGLVSHIRLVTLGFRIVTQALFFLVAIHLQLVLEHVSREVYKAAPL